MLFIVVAMYWLPLNLSAQSNPTDIQSFKYIFTKNDKFTVSFADYPQGEEEFYELGFKSGSRLPSEIKSHTPGLKITGNNHSDDLFMFAFKKLNGLKPNTSYRVQFSLEFASNAPTGSVGSGGSPGDSVYLKIGAIASKPARYLDDAGYYRMALDKGNQALDGKDMVLIGTIGVDTHDELYRLKTLPYQPDSVMQEKLDNYTVTSNDKGEVWVVFGTDSAFESTTTIYFTNLVAVFKEMK
ncbi:hypothetical protein [uncultured Legionella sp.]|uniref:hypothetical protein n=1 Tax=uncultured Legionella sp. TaxID=210934 RepID=UPI00260D00B5|nr:hypothetical protein [uncultured Legionella sp.]